MKKRSCTLMEKYIRLIQSGKKTVEARVAIDMFKKWQKGDVVVFFSRRNPDIRVTTKIIEINEYSSFREMLESESPDCLIPGQKDVLAAEREYLRIPKYAEREKLGVLAFQIRV